MGGELLRYDTMNPVAHRQDILSTVLYYNIIIIYLILRIYGCN
jgi:hypothetical protein